MLKPAVFLSLCFALPSLASPIVRVSDFTVPGFGKVQIEVSIPDQSVGQVFSTENVVRMPEDSDDAPASCFTRTTFAGPVIVYTLKDASGKALNQVTQTTLTENRIPVAVNTDDSCVTASAVGTTTNFFHPDQFANFNLKSASGKSIQLSVSLFFIGSVTVANDSTTQATVDLASVRTLRYFVNNQSQGTTSLLDPAAPPAPPYENPEDLQEYLWHSSEF